MLLLVFALAHTSFQAGLGSDVRVGHWNVYWKALGDPAGRQAITTAIDTAAAISPFDFFSINEAAGPSGDDNASFPEWLGGSTAFGPTAGMQHMHGVSGHETIALLYQSRTWRPIWSTNGEFEKGRPYILAAFESLTGDGRKIFVLSAHTPHYPQTNSFPGQELASALLAGASATGSVVADVPLLIMGDFNEFGECSLPPDVKCTSIPETVLGPLAKWSPFWYHATSWAMAPLWNLTAIADAVPFNTTTCCTKWHEEAADWRHHFDHIYYSSRHLGVAVQPTFIPYTYPALSVQCETPACTGDSPPGGVKPEAQGSWHRGWQASFSFRGVSALVFA